MTSTRNAPAPWPPCGSKAQKGSALEEREGGSMGQGQVTACHPARQRCGVAVTYFFLRFSPPSSLSTERFGWRHCGHSTMVGSQPTAVGESPTLFGRYPTAVPEAAPRSFGILALPPSAPPLPGRASEEERERKTTSQTPASRREYVPSIHHQRMVGLGGSPYCKAVPHRMLVLLPNIQYCIQIRAPET